MSFQRPALNPQEPIIDLAKENVGKPSKSFLIFMRDQRADLDAAPSTFPPVVLQGQSASIAATSIPTDGSLSEGVYRATVYEAITTADAVSSSVQTTISWTENGVTKQRVGTAVTGNTTATVGGFTFMFRADSASPITYATTVALGSGNGRYELVIVLERMAAL